MSVRVSARCQRVCTSGPWTVVRGVTPSECGGVPPRVGVSRASGAAALAARDWAVVPAHTVSDGRCSCGRVDCPAPGKHPRVRWERFQRSRPATSQVAAWWRRWPDANVAVVTGTVSGVLVLDVDPRHAGDETLARLEEGWGALPRTVETRTGGGGRHLWFRLDAPLPSGPLAPGLDFRADGGLVVVPPSTHVSGASYEWARGRGPDECEVSDAPAWLLALAHGAGIPSHAGAPAREGAPRRTDEERRAFAAAWARAGVQLRPGDHNYLCPFHDDHHPSLHVDADGCRWHCFGCGRGGGIGALRRALHEDGRHRPFPRLQELADHPTPGAPAPTIAGTTEIDVVGEARFQDALLALTGGVRHYGGVDARTVAHLAPDPDAPLDSDADRADGRS